MVNIESYKNNFTRSIVPQGILEEDKYNHFEIVVINNNMKLGYWCFGLDVEEGTLEFKEVHNIPINFNENLNQNIKNLVNQFIEKKETTI